MLFHTWSFVVFFAVVYPLYLLLRRTRLRLLWILVVSYFFYACFNPLYPLIVFYSTVVDYLAAARMEASSRKKIWLVISVFNNLALLVFFKYGAFITDNINFLLSRVGAGYAVAEPGILLPVGLSFYIFQSIGYMVDVYRGRVERERSFIAYAGFVAFFPRLVSGPIERAANLLPQLRAEPVITKEDISDGLSLFVVGLFKKVALADYFALYVDKVYGAPGQFQAPALILATFLFAWQIYLDFSGYTDMARGIARLMGVRLMLNFNNPYLATGLGEFWSRWHISLSSWFKDYVYVPLGGNRKGMFNTYRNMFLTMVISGLWHGAAWTFVLWGTVHATGRILTRELERTSFYKNSVPKLVKQIIVFLFVSFAWIFFRAESITDARLIVERIFGSGYVNPYCPILALSFVLFVWLYQFVYESRLRSLVESTAVRMAIVGLMVLYLAVFAHPGGRAFVYSQF